MSPEFFQWRESGVERVRTSQNITIPGIVGERPISVWTPQQTPKGLALFFDGQNIFGDQGTLAGGLHTHSYFQAREQAGLAVPLVVGLHHGPLREQELSPFPPFPDQPGLGATILSWVQGILIPELQREFQCEFSSEHNLIGGSSLGGLLALYGLFHYPDLYQRALVMSPALWPDRFAIFQDLMMCLPAETAKIYLDHGQKEGPADRRRSGRGILGPRISGFQAIAALARSSRARCHPNSGRHLLGARLHARRHAGRRP